MIITGASIYDPATGQTGARRDISISGGTIGPSGGGPRVDAPDSVAMAGGLDIHAHPLALVKLARLAGGLDEWGDMQSMAREFLSAGITWFAEAGLPETDEPLAAEAARAGIGAGLLCLDNIRPPFIAKKVFGAGGMDYCLNAPESATPPHLHLPSLARGEAFGVLDDFVKKLGRRRCHLSHVSHYAFEGNGKRLRGLGAKAATLFNKAPGLTADCGPVVFGPALTFTADAELANRVSKSGSGAITAHPDSPFRATRHEFKKDNYIDSLLWINGMEFILSAEDLSRLSLSIDFPSGGKIGGYPRIIACLMERDRRAEFMAALHPDAVEYSALRGIRRELSLSEIALVTRAAPAGALGIKNRGSLAVGSAADVVILRETGDIERMFANPRMVIRDGKIVLEDEIWK